MNCKNLKTKNLIKIIDEGYIDNEVGSKAILMPFLKNYKNINELKFQKEYLIDYLKLYKKIWITLKEIYFDGYVYSDIYGVNIMVDKKLNHMYVDPNVISLLDKKGLDILNFAKLKLLGMLFKMVFLILLYLNLNITILMI